MQQNSIHVVRGKVTRCKNCTVTQIASVMYIVDGTFNDLSE